MATHPKTITSFLAVFLVIFCFSTQIAQAADEHAPRASILSPADGAVVTSPVTVKFGLENMMISPAGVEHANSGHHHLLIDTPLPADMTLPIPSDANHVHFGKGQTETTIELPPGKHSLQLLVGDHMHRPHAHPVISEKITITVK